MRTQIRNNPGLSSYFQGGYRGYGRYQWNIKYYGWQNDYEIESAVLWGFGDYVKIGTKAINGNTIRGFYLIGELVGRPIESFTAGRSGGWLVVNTELTEEELTKIDSHVESVMKSLPSFLEEERSFRKEEEEAAQREENLREEKKLKVFKKFSVSSFEGLIEKLLEGEEHEEG